MAPDEIIALLNLIGEKDFSEFELEREGLRIRVVKPTTAASVEVPSVGTRVVEHAVNPPVSVALPAVDPALYVVKAPMVGTFFRSPSPSAEAFVKVGDRVKKGQVVCIIEAMKLMNEIESEVTGVVAEVIVENGQPVEFGEPLYRVRQER